MHKLEHWRGKTITAALPVAERVLQPDANRSRQLKNAAFQQSHNQS